jgi:glutamate formiminotransferase / 5-formyltetrahydrofolate cyclo-ligase
VLISVPNVSEGSREDVIEAVGKAFEPARLLRLHRDPDHGRSVYTLAARQGELAAALVRGAKEAARLIDLREHAGIHPHVGAIDVAPVVFLDEARREAARAEALAVATRLGTEVGLPVFLYGILSGTPPRTRASLRRGGLAELTRRLATGELAPDFGPAAPHPTAGAVLVAARPPLVAFNVELAPPATVADARVIAATIREGGAEGLPGVRALGLELTAQGGVAQVSTNVEDHLAVPLADVVAAVARHAPVAACELVGLAPAAAFAGFPDDVPVKGRRTVEEALGTGA